MAPSKQLLLLAAVVASVACLASLASATQYVIGGDQCDDWKRDFNQAYANGKTFVVGDTLLFKYEQGKHKVAQVASEDDFNSCNKDGNRLGEWCSGNDVVQLNSPGTWWFICAKGDHCSKGMKLAINVVSAAPPPPVFGWPFPGATPPPPSPFGWQPPYPGLAPPPPPFFGWSPPFPVTTLPPPPPSAALRNPVGGAVAVTAVAVVVAALAF